MTGKGGGNSILRGAGLMGVATFMSRILGLVREQVFAIFFGAGNATDAFNIAFRIPNLLRDLFAEGAMSSAFVPTFVKVREKEGQRRAWRVAGLVFRVLFFAVILLSIAGVFFSENLVDLYASSYREVPEKFELTVFLTQILFPFFPFVVLAAAFMAVLNASGVFFLPAFGPALFNLVTIVVGVFLSILLPQHFNIHPISGMAIGVVFGGLVQAFVQIPKLRSVGYRFPKRETTDPVWYKDPALQKMLLLMGPGVLGLAATQINILVNSILATGEGSGAVSWLNYAFRLMMFPIGVFGVSLAVATLPKFSESVAKENWNQAWEELNRSLRYVFAINFPAAAGLVFVGAPIIQLIFEYGQFQSSDTQATAMALAAYASGLTFYSCVKVLVPACYAMSAVKLAVVSSVVSVGVNIVFNLLLIGPLGYWGLALGTSITMLLNSLFLYVMLGRRMGRKSVSIKDEGWKSFKSLLVHFCLAVLMGVLVYGLWSQTEIWWSAFESGTLQTVLTRIAKVLSLIIAGVVFILAASKILGVAETSQVLDLLVVRIRKRLSSSK